MTDGSSSAWPNVRPVGGFGQVALRQLVGDGAAERQAVGVHAAAGEEDDRVAVTDVADDALGFGFDAADGGAGEDDRLGIDDALERGRFAAAPDGAGATATFCETASEIVGRAACSRTRLNRRRRRAWRRKWGARRW